MKARIVKNRIQTIRNMLTDLNRILQNTETFHKNFIRYGIAVKPPHEGSHLVYNVDINRYHFWKPNKTELSNLKLTSLNNFVFQHNVTIKFDKYIYYPNGLPYIVLLDDISWMTDLYNLFAFKPEHVEHLSTLYGSKLYEYIMKACNEERQHLVTSLTCPTDKTNTKLF